MRIDYIAIKFLDVGLYLNGILLADMVIKVCLVAVAISLGLQSYYVSSDRCHGCGGTDMEGCWCGYYLLYSNLSIIKDYA